MTTTELRSALDKIITDAAVVDDRDVVPRCQHCPHRMVNTGAAHQELTVWQCLTCARSFALGITPQATETLIGYDSGDNYHRSTRSTRHTS